MNQETARRIEEAEENARKTLKAARSLGVDPAFEPKALGVIWFNEMGSSNPIGIVLMHNGFETKAYIGTGFGYDERMDIEKIMSNGAKFPLELATGMSFNPISYEQSTGGPSP